MGIFDLFPADPNIDSPKRFVIYVVILVVVLVLIIAGIQLFPRIQASIAALNQNASTTDQTTGNTGTVSSPSKPTPAGYDILISYTDKGFSPATLQVKAGASVRFINKSGGTMRVMSVKSSSSAADYTDFNQSASVGRNGTYDFSFTRRGTWLYENLNNPTKTGVIVVN